jgi:hypothetical protein
MLVTMALPLIKGGDTGGFLTSMLEGKQTKIGKPGYILTGSVKAEYTTGFFWLIGAIEVGVVRLAGGGARQVQVVGRKGHQVSQ